MNTDTTHPALNAVHLGNNIKRLREILGKKQQTLANELELSQQSISRFEAKEILDDALLNSLATALQITSDAVKNFREEPVEIVL